MEKMPKTPGSKTVLRVSSAAEKTGHRHDSGRLRECVLTRTLDPGCGDDAMVFTTKWSPILGGSGYSMSQGALSRSPCLLSSPELILAVCDRGIYETMSCILFLFFFLFACSPNSPWISLQQRHLVQVQVQVVSFRDHISSICDKTRNLLLCPSYIHNFFLTWRQNRNNAKQLFRLSHHLASHRFSSTGKQSSLLSVCPIN